VVLLHFFSGGSVSNGAVAFFLRRLSVMVLLHFFSRRFSLWRCCISSPAIQSVVVLLHFFSGDSVSNGAGAFLLRRFGQ
jgi:hypothetical protein